MARIKPYRRFPAMAIPFQSVGILGVAMLLAATTNSLGQVANDEPENVATKIPSAATGVDRAIPPRVGRE